MNKIIVNEYPARQAFLEFGLDTVDISIETLTEIALDTLQKISGNNFDFYCLDISLSQFDEEFVYPISDFDDKDSKWMLIKKSKNKTLKCDPIWQDQKSEIVDDFDKSSIVEFIKKFAMEKQTKSTEGITLWETIKFRAVEAKIETEINNSLLVEWMNHTTEYPVEIKDDEQFVYGPLLNKSVPAPLEIGFSNDGGSLKLIITIYWSYWTDDKMKGSEKVKNSIKSLSETGWKLTSSNLFTT